MNTADVLKIASSPAFMPELRPLVPDIVVGLATIQKARAILQPVIVRAEAGLPAFIEMAEVAPALEAMSSEITKALKTLENVQTIVAAYLAKTAL